MLNIYVTYDKVSEEYSQPWFAKNDNVAIRNIRIASQRDALPLDDIELHCIGCYNSDTGLLYDYANGNISLEGKSIDLSILKNSKE